MIYIDMDGVLAKWNTEATTEETKKAGYFLSREPDEKIIDLINVLKLLGKDFTILSAVYDNGYARNEKSEWLDRIDRSIKRIFVPYGKRKSDYIEKSGCHILIDDFTDNLLEWEKAGNIGIKYNNGINGTRGRWKKAHIDSCMDVYEMLDVLLREDCKTIKGVREVVAW